MIKFWLSAARTLTTYTLLNERIILDMIVNPIYCIVFANLNLSTKMIANICHVTQRKAV